MPSSKVTVEKSLSKRMTKACLPKVGTGFGIKTCVKIKNLKRMSESERSRRALVLQSFGLEGAGDHLFPHAVEQRQRRGLAIGAQHLAESRLQRRLGDDFRLDARRQAFRPCLAVALNGGQTFFFPDQCVDVADTMFHCDVHLTASAIQQWIRLGLSVRPQSQLSHCKYDIFRVEIHIVGETALNRCRA
ncbi:hypothetical protein MPLA_1220044 [Mesorhizobium sp. ORS 3359]|nr:hypothetical protein MPLA_1220044 [Mesorhizobium sp. ORS 3359]